MNGKKCGYLVLSLLLIFLLAIAGILGFSLAKSRSSESKLKTDLNTLNGNYIKLRDSLDAATSSLERANSATRTAQAECDRAVATNNELRGYIQTAVDSQRELKRFARSNDSLLDECLSADASGAKLFAECFEYLKLLRNYFERLEQASKAAGNQ